MISRRGYQRLLSVGNSVRHEHLQVHWPVGQAHELPQEQVQPGPAVESVSVLLAFLGALWNEHTHVEM